MSVELLFSHSVLSDSLQPHGLQHARQASLSFTIFQSLLKLTSIEWVMPSNHLVLCLPLLLLPSSFPSIRVQWSCGGAVYFNSVFTCLPMRFKCARYFETNELILCQGILFFLDSCRIISFSIFTLLIFKKKYIICDYKLKSMILITITTHTHAFHLHVPLTTKTQYLWCSLDLLSQLLKQSI